VGIILMAPPNRRARKYRKIIAGCLYFMWLPMIIFFIRHMKNIPGSEGPRGVMLMVGYSLFSLAEWTLVLLEAAFDTVSILDFRRFELQVVEIIEEEDEEEAGKTSFRNIILIFRWNPPRGLRGFVRGTGNLQTHFILRRILKAHVHIRINHMYPFEPCIFDLKS
jgi:hypothetical protein